MEETPGDICLKERVEDSFERMKVQRELKIHLIAYKKRIEDSFDNIEDYAESNLQDDKIKKEKVTRDFDLNEKADCGFDLNKFPEEDFQKMILDRGQKDVEIFSS